MVDKQDTATTIREVDTDDNEDHFALIVEDDTVNQNYMTKALTKRGYICKIASTVTDAITHIDELIKNETYFEVIFLDIFLENDQYGVDLLKYRKDNKIDDIGVCIIMTGNEELHIIQECNKYNIQNYIRKPVTSSNLEYEIMRVNAIVKKQKCPIKGYKNERKLGQGGMGEVFLVKHKQTKMLYAMKRVQVQSDDKSYNSEERFHKGCKAPTILELKDSKMHDGYIYMIIEYAEHGTLSDWITKQKTNIKNYVLNVDLVLKWMCEMFIGLFILHDKSLIHRDIKSDNLFLCKDFVLKIGDLGVARAIERVANTVVGTHHYMAPEIHRKEEYGQKVDIWAAGIVLYEIVMFEKPFDGSADEIIHKINKLNFKQLPKSIDQRIHTLLKHTLNPDVSSRMSSKEILNLNFMQEVLNKIYEEKLIDIDDDLIFMISKQDDKNISKEELKVKKKQEEIGSKQMRQFFIYFTQAMKIDLEIPTKTTYQKGYLSTVYNNVIKGNELSEFLEEYNNQKENKEKEEMIIKDLIANKFITNVSNPKEEDFIDNDKNFYQINFIEDPDVDNSTICPASYAEAKEKDPIQLTIDCLNMIICILKRLEEDGYDDENKFNILTSREYYYFLVEIIQIKHINFKAIKNKNDKLAIILNIYQTMYIHLLIKFELGTSNNANKGGVISKLSSLVFSGSKKKNIVYNIGGFKMSLYDLKHITIRRNKKPLDAYMRLASSGDEREKLIEGGENNKLLFVCHDPPIISWEEVEFKPTFKAFTSEVSKELETFCNEFSTEYIQIDDSEIRVPKFFKDYLVDFQSNEQEMIKFLIKIINNPEIKATKVIKDINNKSTIITYY